MFVTFIGKQQSIWRPMLVLLQNKRIKRTQNRLITISKPRVDDLLGGVQECPPVLLNQPLDLPPGVKTQIDLPVMQGGPVAAVDEDKAEKEEADKGSMRK